MGIDDQVRSIENRLTALEKERSDLLGNLKTLRAQRDEHKPVVLLGRPTLTVVEGSKGYEALGWHLVVLKFLVIRANYRLFGNSY